MKKWMLIVILLFFTVNAKADTLSFCHVYHNKLKIGNFNLLANNQIELKKEAVRDGDSLIIHYFKDTPCYDCLTHLAVENGKHRSIAKSEKKGTFTPHLIALKDLLDLSPGPVLEVFYWEGELQGRTQKELLFTILIE